MTDTELPDDFRIQDAQNGDRIESADGDVEYLVLVDEWTGERRTVRADAVEWDAWHEHPMAQAAAAMGLLAVLFGGLLYGGGVTAELLAGAYENTEPEVWRLTYGWGVIIGITVVSTMALLFRRTRARWWMYRWEKYARNRQDLKRARSE